MTPLLDKFPFSDWTMTPLLAQLDERETMGVVTPKLDLGLEF